MSWWWAFAILLACGVCWAAPDLERGQKLYLSNCAPCHGPRGDGGKGADLTQPRLPRAADDESFFQIIRRGIPGTEMPLTRHLLDQDIRDVIAYVRTLSLTTTQKTAGDPTRGAELYRTKGNCAQCHMVRGAGGWMGPELTDIGSRRSAAYIRTSLTDPEAAVPESFFLYRFVTFIPDNFLQVRVLAKDGKQITGIRLNEDPFSIQIRDFSGRFHSFWKGELGAIDKQWGKSPMPSYGDVFTAAELDDLVAHLVSLR